MATCPNKNLDSWKLLTTSRGEDVAYYLWDKYEGNVPESESKESIVKSGLKATSILQSPKSDQFFASVTKNRISGDFFWKKMQVDLGIPKDQIEILKSFNTQDRGELIAFLLGNYSYAVEINVSREKEGLIKNGTEFKVGEDYYYSDPNKNVYTILYSIDNGGGSKDISKQEFENARQNSKPTQHYSNLTVPGGTNYTENEIATPAITPSIKGHAQFATDQGIGWFRSDDKAISKKNIGETEEYYDKNFNRITKEEHLKLYPIINTEITDNKTRRILEVQSDLFQKGRDKQFLAGFASDLSSEEEVSFNRHLLETGQITQQEFDNPSVNPALRKENQFLQLLNQGSNWVTFFVKSILQDSAKKGYEKVLFPSGDTASKVEGHTTLEEFKKQKEDRIKELESKKPEIFEDDGRFEVLEPNQGATMSILDTREEAERLWDKMYGDKYKNEIAQLKQELERVDREGFASLKPIYNFYENTVTNILNKQYGKESVKQITDEYGNTWNEISIVPEREQQSVMLQEKGTESSKASAQTIKMVKDFLNRIGVSIENVDQIVVNGIKEDANGAALITQQLVKVVNGKQDVALTEEAMHFAVEILQQTNAPLFKKLLSEINGYAILNQVYNTYGSKPGYQIDGKPDIIKLKKEAIAKVLTETIIKRNEGSTEKPELIAKAETWWQQIINALKSIFFKSGFDQAAMKVLSGEAIGTVEDIRAQEGEVFLQQTGDPQKRIVDELRDIDSKLVKKPVTIDGKQEDRYFFDGATDYVKYRVTDFIKDWFSQKFADKDLLQSEYEEALNDLKKETGTEFHFDQEFLIKGYGDGNGGVFVDANGKLRDEADILDDSAYVSQMDPNNRGYYDILKKNMWKRLSDKTKFPEGTIFLAEMKLFNKKNVAGTVDFIAVTPAGKVSILDWKFIGLNTQKYDDVPWYKIDAWRQQMQQYVSILQGTYGVKPENIDQARMIPIVVKYSGGSEKLGVLPKVTKIEIGNVDPTTESRDYLLPVGLESESTGDKKLDALLSRLNKVYEDMSTKKAVTEEQKQSKAILLNTLFKAIRQLQVKQEMRPLVDQAKLINKEAQNLIDEYNETWKNPSEELSRDAKARDEFSGRLFNFEDSLKVYESLSIDLKSFFRGELSEEDEKLWRDIKDTAENAKELESDLEEIRTEFMENVVAAREGFTDYLKPEKIIKGITRLFGSTSITQLKSAQLLFRMANRALGYAAQDTADEGNELKTLKENFDKWAKSKGLSKKDYFKLIKKSGSNELIDEFDPEFYSKLKKAINSETPDYEWIKNNIDVEAYKAHLKEKLEKENEYAINKARISDDPEGDIDKDMLQNEKLYNIDDNDSFGWLLYNEARKFPKKSNWESQEWKELHKAGNEPALAFYDYIRKKNEEYHEIGYVTNSRTFLPFVRKGFLEKVFYGGKMALGEDLLRSLTIEEGDVGFGQINPITKEPVYNIPKYFTRKIDGETSDDLFKNMALLNEMAIRYKYLSQIENQVKLLLRTESQKEAIKTSYYGTTKYKKDGTVETTSDNTENTELVRDMIESIIYGHKYVESSNFDQLLGGIGNFGKRANKLFGRKILPEKYDNAQISLNKVVDSINNYFQVKSLGLNPISSLANLLGGSFQTYINAGKYYTKSEFLKNEFMITQRMHGVDQKKYVGALQYFLPLTESFNKQIASELSLNKLNAQSLQEILMSLMRNADQFVQSVNFFSYLDNSIVVDGNVVNVREYLKTTPEFANIYKVNQAERAVLQKKFEEEVERLKKEQGVMALAKIENNQFVIPGVDRKSDSVIELRRKVQAITKDALGNLSDDDVRKINMNIVGKSFMMFKNWIPRLVDVRFGDIKYNAGSDSYEWGRTRMVANFLGEGIITGIKNLTDAVYANDKGVEYMMALYEKKKETYERETGKTLEMTPDEFIDLVRQNIKNQAVDLMMYLALTALFFGARALAPDDDDDKFAKNQHKFLMRVIDKVRDEVAYFYNPMGLINLSKGGVFPALSGIVTPGKTLINTLNEMYGLSMGDGKGLNGKSIDENYVIKYGLKSLPITSTLADTILLLFFPDVAKDLGMRAQSEAKPMGL
jgi:hypothetical protein